MDGNTKAIAEALRRWYEAPCAKVIDFAAAKERLDRRRQTYSRTPSPTSPRAA